MCGICRVMSNMCSTIDTAHHKTTIPKEARIDSFNSISFSLLFSSSWGKNDRKSNQKTKLSERDSTHSRDSLRWSRRRRMKCSCRNRRSMMSMSFLSLPQLRPSGDCPPKLILVFNPVYNKILFIQ